MYIDGNLLLCDAQSFTVDALSTNTIDLGSQTPKRQMGDGEPLCVVVQVDVSADFTTGDETYEFQVIESANANLSTATIIAQQTYIASGVMISSLLVAGYILVIPIPPGFPTQRYLGLNFNGGGTTPTITFTAWLTPLALAGVKPQTYASGFAVL